MRSKTTFRVPQRVVGFFCLLTYLSFKLSVHICFETCPLLTRCSFPALDSELQWPEAHVLAFTDSLDSAVAALLLWVILPLCEALSLFDSVDLRKQ